MILYVVRHGQTQYNVEKRFQGQVDVPLNSTGMQQVMDLSYKLSDIHLDLIISSPLSRALDTAKSIQKNNNVPIIINNDLIERGFGNFEGLTDLSPYDCDINKLLDYNLNYSLQNVEPIQSLFRRISDFISKCYSKKKKKTILLSTHGGVVEVIECLLKNLPFSTNLKSLSLSNSEYRKYDDLCISRFIQNKNKHTKKDDAIR